MTYQIYYTRNPKERGFCMFDIEFYLDQFVVDRWYTEIQSSLITEGIVKFLQDKQGTDFDYDQFIKDAEEIRNLRGTINESPEFADMNNTREITEATHIKNKVFLPYIENAVQSFAKKYGFYVNVD